MILLTRPSLRPSIRLSIHPFPRTPHVRILDKDYATALGHMAVADSLVEHSGAPRF